MSELYARVRYRRAMSLLVDRDKIFSVHAGLDFVLRRSRYGKDQQQRVALISFAREALLPRLERMYRRIHFVNRGVRM